MSLPSYFLTTPHLGFREWRESDFDLALGLWGDYNVTKLIDARGQLDETQVRERLAKEINNAKQFGIQYWALFLLANDEHIGCCGVRPYDATRNILEIGFHIRSRYWRCGYASEAARAVIAYAFNQLHVSALFAGHNPKNESSRNLLLKLGFRYTHDEFYPPTGLQHPSYLLTADEFARGNT